MAADQQQKSRHETVLDVDGEQLARVYAQAFLGAAGQGPDDAEPAVAELEAVVDEVIDQHPQFATAIESAFLSHDDRAGMIDRVLRGRVADVVLNTLKVMSSHGRAGLLRTMAREARTLLNEAKGLVAVEVTSAAPLTPELQSTLQSALGEKLGIVPVLSVGVDPELIAGIKLRVGDTVYDGSLRTVFAKARSSMVRRAIERIENSPERFLAPAGGGPAETDAAE